MALSRLALVSAVLAASAVASRPARADSATTELCLSTNDRAQSLRNEKKLREAREQLKICSQPTCPSAVQRDCSQWLREVETALPTLSFGAKGSDGADLTSVRVSVDGRILVEQLDGSSIAVDPGKHTFRFDHEGDPEVTQDLVVNEGDKARRIDVRFGTPASPSEPPKPKTPGRYDAFPFVLGGIGAVAMVGGFVFMANRNTEIPDNCKRVAGHCDNVPLNDPILDRATSLKNQSYVGLGIGIGGAALLAGGIVWFIAESAAKPKAPKSEATLKLSPVVGLHSLGLAGTF